MIIDSLSNIEFYKGLNNRIYKGLKFLREMDLDSLALGKYIIEGENIFANVQEYKTKYLEQCRWEGHYKYTDIQYIISGEEMMGYVNMEETSKIEEKPSDDILFLNANGNFINMKEGYFVIFTPQDAHMPSIAVEQPKNIKKVVIKVAL